MTVATLGADATDSLGTDVTTAAGANTKGSYAELEDSLAAACHGLVAMFNCATANEDFLTDIATGAAASETVVIANLPANTGGSRYLHYAPVPLAIAQSARIAARTQSTNAGAVVVRVILYAWTVDTTLPYGCTAVDTYGANTADSGGVNVDPGGSANTKGSYSEVTASTTNAIEQLTVGIGNVDDAARSSQNWLCDIATGAAAAESVVVADLALAANLSVDIMYPGAVPALPVAIASSTRLAARAQSDGTTAGDRTFDVILFGARGASAVGGGAGGGAHILGGTVVR